MILELIVIQTLIDEAKNENYDIIVIEMDTYGGAVNDADDIRTRILDFENQSTYG